MAGLSRCSEEQVRTAEAGEPVPKSVLEGIAKALGVSPDSLWPAAPPTTENPREFSFRRVFVSYDRSDKDYVYKFIVPKLEQYPIVYWIDRDIPLGSDFTKEISAAIKESDTVLVVLSKKAVQSDWVRREVHLAFERKPQACVVPVLIEECNPNDLYPGLSLCQHIKLYEDKKAGLARLLTELYPLPVTEPCPPFVTGARTTRTWLWPKTSRRPRSRRPPGSARRGPACSASTRGATTGARHTTSREVRSSSAGTASCVPFR